MVGKDSETRLQTINWHMEEIKHTSTPELHQSRNSQTWDHKERKSLESEAGKIRRTKPSKTLSQRKKSESTENRNNQGQANKCNTTAHKNTHQSNFKQCLQAPMV